MKTTLLSTSLLAIVFALSCERSVANPASETLEAATAPRPAETQVSTEDAALQMKDATFGQKTEFVMAMRAQLAGLTRDMEELSERIKKSSEAVKAEAAPRFDVLREKAAKLSKQIDELAEATLPTWDVMKADTVTAYAELKEGISQSRQAVRDKVAP